MPIVYSAIAHQGEIECAFQAETGQFARVVDNYLLSHDRVIIFTLSRYLVTLRQVYFGVSDAEFPQRLVWVFLRKIRDLYEEDSTKHFDEILEKRMVLAPH